MKLIRFFSIMMIGAMIFLLVACTSPEKSPSETTASPTDIPSETTASADNITDPPTASGTEAPSGETTAEDETTAEETTAEETTAELVLTASPSLGSVEDVPGVGLRYGEIVIAGIRYRLGGLVYSGKDENGVVFWSPMDEESQWRPISAGRPLSEDTPILVVSLNDEIEVINHTGFPIVATYYCNYQTGDFFTQNSKPTDPGIYILSITVKEPIPTEADPEPEIGTVFSEWGYYFLVVVEK